MYIQINDGVVVFATHILKCDPSLVRKNLALFQCEKEGVVIYPGDDMTKAEKVLRDIPYTVETLDYEEYKPISQGIKYASRTEAIKHFTENVEPESETVPRLKKKLADAEAKLAEKDIQLSSLESKFSVIEQKVKKGGL